MAGLTVTTTTIDNADRPRKKRVRRKRVTFTGLLLTYDDAEKLAIPWRHVRVASHGIALPASEFRKNHPGVPRSLDLSSGPASAARRLIDRQLAMDLAESRQPVIWRQSSPRRVFFGMVALGALFFTVSILIVTAFDVEHAKTVLQERLAALPALDEFMVVFTLTGFSAIWLGMCFALAHATFPYWNANRRRWPRDVKLTADTLEITDTHGGTSRHQLADLTGAWGSTLEFSAANGVRTRVALEPFRAETRLWLRVLARRLPRHIRTAYDRHVVRHLGAVTLLMSFLSELQLRYLKPLAAQPGDAPGVPGGMLALGLALCCLAEFARWRIGLRPSLRRRWWKNFRHGRLRTGSGAG